MRTRLLALGLLLTVAVTVVLAHEGHAPLPTRGATVDPAKGLVVLSAEARAALDVRTDEIGTVAPSDSVLAYVKLVAPWQRHAFAGSRLAGRITALHARPGDRVEAGAVLAEVQSQEVETLQLEARTARTEVALAERVLQGIRKSAGAVPAREQFTAETQLRQAHNALELARVKWAALGLPADRLDTPTTLPVRSPIGGTVVHADLTVGKGVEPGEHLFELIDYSTVWAKIEVLEKDIPRVDPGRPVEVRLTAYPGEVFRGTVAVVGQALDPVTHLNDVWAELRNDPSGEPRLLPGLYGQARIELPAATGTRTIPTTALVDDGVDRFVLVEDASAKGVSEFHKASVVVVRETPTAVVVRSPDLLPGDRVVTRGGLQLGAFFQPHTLKLTPEAVRTLGLTVEPAAVQTVDSTVEIPGAVDLPPDRRGVGSSRLPGTITSVRVAPGQAVRQGEVLAEVFSLELLTLQLDLLREQLAAELAGRQLDWVRSLKETAATRRLAEAEAAVATAVNRRDSLRRRLELVGLTSEQLDALVTKRQVAAGLPVLAPVAGTVVAFDRVVGQSVRADEPLVTVHDLSRPWVQGFVTEQELTRVRVGQAARVRLVGNPGVVLTGKVARTGRTFGTSHRTLSVWVELDADPPAPLRHNQMARLSVVTGSPTPALAVPLSAVARDGNRAFVFVRTGDTFDRREVALGRADDRNVEIASGLRAGEPVAVTAADGLHTAWASVR